MENVDVEGMAEYGYEDVLMEALDRIKVCVQGFKEKEGHTW